MGPTLRISKIRQDKRQNKTVTIENIPMKDNIEDRLSPYLHPQRLPQLQVNFRARRSITPINFGDTGLGG